MASLPALARHPAMRLNRRRLRGAAAVLCAVAAGGALAAPPAVPAYREFRDWIVACDNTRRCEARLAPAAGDPVEQRFVLSRTAGPEGVATVELDGEKPLPPRPLQLDGTLLGAADQPGPGSAWTRDGEGGNRLEGVGALRLGRLLAQGRALVLGTAQGPVRLPLDGLAASLLFIDDVQGRVGNSTAWREPGNGAGTQVPPAPAPPELRAAPVPPPLADADAFALRVRSRNKALVAARCDPPRDAAGTVDQAMPLTASDALVLLNCWNGAYQSSALVLRVPRAAPEAAKPVALPLVPGGLPRDPTEDAAVLTEAFYDPDTATLTSSAKGRGLADCGVALGWVFDGRAFQAASRDEQRRCAGSPGDWPALYRSRTVPATAPAGAARLPGNGVPAAGGQAAASSSSSR